MGFLVGPRLVHRARQWYAGLRWNPGEEGDATRLKTSCVPYPTSLSDLSSVKRCRESDTFPRNWSPAAAGPEARARAKWAGSATAAPLTSRGTRRRAATGDAWAACGRGA